jgi:hypothetical protein
MESLHDRLGGGDAINALRVAYLLSWSGWPDLNRRHLRPEAKLRRGLPAPQHASHAADRPCVRVRWRPPLSVAMVNQFVRRSAREPVVSDCCPLTLSKSVDVRSR